MARTEPFDELSQKYDNWFDRFASVYESELAAVREAVLAEAKGVEIGVGTGRFAAPLDITEGVEPSEEMSRRARERGVTVHKGIAENLPLPDHQYDDDLMVTTICFLVDPDKAIEEMLRVIKKEGSIILGFGDRESPLGKS